MIVVTAPTGQIGSKVLSHLLTANESIRVIARQPERLSKEVSSRVDVVIGSHADPVVVDQAFAGATSLFWLVPADPQARDAHAAYVDFSRPACAAMKRHGIKRVVGISALGRGWKKDAGHVTATIAVDDMIAQAGCQYRALCCGTLMENVLRQVSLIKAQGVFYGTAPRNLQGTAVATKDIAGVAASLLLKPTWSGVEEVPLKGPGDLSNDEMAQIMSDALDRPVRYEEMAMADFKGLLLKRGNSEGMAQAMINMMIAKNDGLDDLAPRPIPNLSSTTFRQWCEEFLKPAIA